MALANEDRKIRKSRKRMLWYLWRNHELYAPAGSTPPFQTKVNEKPFTQWDQAHMPSPDLDERPCFTLSNSFGRTPFPIILPSAPRRRGTRRNLTARGCLEGDSNAAVVSAVAAFRFRIFASVSLHRPPLLDLRLSWRADLLSVLPITPLQDGSTLEREIPFIPLVSFCPTWREWQRRRGKKTALAPLDVEGEPGKHQRKI